MANSKTTVAPGEGERSAQRGYTGQYGLSAAAIYDALRNDELEWVGLADRSAGIADDVVLGFPTRVVGHQFKMSKFADQFRLNTLLNGADGLLQPLSVAWQTLKRCHPGKSIEIRLVTNDYPSKKENDRLTSDKGSHSAAFLSEFGAMPKCSLAEWRASKWQPFIDELCKASGLSEPDFDEFLQSLTIVYGPAADFVQTHRLTPEDARLAEEIAAILPRLVADLRDKDRWTRAELLHELRWRDSAVTHHVHRFPVGVHVQRNAPTELALREAIDRNTSGYLSLVGPPGAGKSTLLQAYLETEQNLLLVRYLAFMPDVGQGLGRGEADDFFDDIVTQLRRTGLRGLRLRDESLHERRENFDALLQEAGDRFSNRGIRTLIVIDGLDHVPREERPERSFLAELPLPRAVPDGVIFVLGTQTLQLDDIRPAVRDQAEAISRTVKVAPLTREAVHRIADSLALDRGIDRDRIFALSRGHPLVTRYLVEALRDADADSRNALLAGAITFDGDIETVYESAWRSIGDDGPLRDVLDYLARSEGPMPLDLLAQAIPEHAIESALKATRHLLAEGPNGWSMFHNSFRLFILGKPKTRLGKRDPGYDQRIYRALAALAHNAPEDSPQRWLELRYLARAEEHASVLAIAAPARFREQLAERRSVAELQADLRLAFTATKHVYDPLKVFQLLLIQDEIRRRSSVFEYASFIAVALLAVGDLDGAAAFVEQYPSEGYEVVDALVNAGDIPRARTLFEQLEPLQQVLSGAPSDHYLEVPELFEWVRRVVHFRDPDQILQAAQRLARLVRLPGWETGQENVDDLVRALMTEAAKTVVAEQEMVDVAEVGQRFGIDAPTQVALRVEAGIAAANRGAIDSALAHFREAVTHAGFPRVTNASRRKAALIAARSSDLRMAEQIFDGLRIPAIADLDGDTEQTNADHLARAVLEHAEVAALLGRPTSPAPVSKTSALRPLQLHCETIGNLLGRAQREPPSVRSGEIAGAARAALTYARHVRFDPGEYHAQRTISFAMSVLGRALIQAAAACGEQEFASTLTELDRFLTDFDGPYDIRVNLRREVAVEIYRHTGDSGMASRRLDAMIEAAQENTPSQQIEELATLAIAFAQSGNVTAARELLARVPQETLGYELAAKKDPQYAVWIELLERANQTDPNNRPRRVAFLLRQVVGMMRTEGDDAAYRIAARLLKEAAICDAQTGWRAGELLVDHGVLGWARFVDALLFGLVKRRPELVPVATVVWCELALPYYMEPFYSESKLGAFIDAAIDAASPADLHSVSTSFLDAIEAESRAHERAALLNRLCRSATVRGACSRDMEVALLRWKTESPPPRHSSTPTRYHDVSSLAELKTKLEQDSTSEGPGYEAAMAFNRLASESSFTLAKEVFDRWDAIRRDSRARFIVANLAIDSGLSDIARGLIDGYDTTSDDRATWTEWTGGSSLRYFKAKLRLDGSEVRAEAYEDFVGSVAAGRESIQSVLLEHDEIFQTLSDEPNWPEMWEALAEQLATTREHALGSVFSVGESSCMSDEDLIVSLFDWAFTLPLDELRRHAFTGALKLATTQGGRPTFVRLVRSLLSGTDDQPADGIQLLLLDASDSAETELDREVFELTDHDDYAVAESATVVARRWGLSPSPRREALPAFYSLVLEDEGAFDRPQLVDPTSGSMVVEDTLGWTFAFEDEVKRLTRSGVSAAHIRHRCRMLIEQWGGLSKFGRSATQELEARLGRLDMRMTYFRPHIAVAARALRYVAGELRRADRIPSGATSQLLFLMGYPAPRPPLIQPAARPNFVRRPERDESNWQAVGDDWLSGAEDDALPLATGAETIVVEVSEFHIRSFRRNFHSRRVRMPAVDLGGEGVDFEGFELLPNAIWLGRAFPWSSTPSPVVARALEVSRIPEVPRYRLIICPFWLQKLGWHHHPSNRLVFQDKGDSLVARVVWWRDGGPVNVGEDVIWGQGMYLSLTPLGLKQIEQLMGELAVTVLVRRSYQEESREEAEQSRVVAAQD